MFCSYLLENRYEDIHITEGFIEDMNLKSNEDFVKKCREAAESGDKTTLKKLTDEVIKHSNTIAIIGAVGSGGIPFLMPASLLGATLGVMTGALIRMAMGDKTVGEVSGYYADQINTQLGFLRKNKKKYEAEGDKEKAKRCDALIKEYTKLEAKLSAQHKKATRESAEISGFNVKLI